MVWPTVMLVRGYGKILTTSVFGLFCGADENQLIFPTSNKSSGKRFVMDQYFAGLIKVLGKGSFWTTFCGDRNSSSFASSTGDVTRPRTITLKVGEFLFVKDDEFRG